MPTPISMVEELLWTLDRIKTLRCAKGAFVEVMNQADDTDVKKRIKRSVDSGRERMLHLDLLHPLLVRMVTVAGHGRHGDRIVLEKLEGVLRVAGLDGDENEEV